MFIQKRLLTREWSMSFLCTTASGNPICPQLANSKLKVVTIATTPKSAGASSRDRTTVAITWIPSNKTWENKVMPAPRTARLRSPPPSVEGKNTPLALKGFKQSPHSRSFRLAPRSARKARRDSWLDLRIFQMEAQEHEL